MEKFSVRGVTRRGFRNRFAFRAKSVRSSGGGVPGSDDDAPGSRRELFCIGSAARSIEGDSRGIGADVLGVRDEAPRIDGEVPGFDDEAQSIAREPPHIGDEARSTDGGA